MSLREMSYIYKKERRIQRGIIDKALVETLLNSIQVNNNTLLIHSHAGNAIITRTPANDLECIVAMMTRYDTICDFLKKPYDLFSASYEDGATNVLKDDWPRAKEVAVKFSQVLYSGSLDTSNELSSPNFDFLEKIFPEMKNDYVMTWVMLEMVATRSMRVLEFSPLFQSNSYEYMNWLLRFLFTDDAGKLMPAMYKVLKQKNGLLDKIKNAFNADIDKLIVDKYFMDCTSHTVMCFQTPREEITEDAFAAGFFMYLCSIENDTDLERIVQLHAKLHFTRKFTETFYQSPLCKAIWKWMSAKNDNAEKALRAILLLCFASGDKIYNTFLCSIDGTDFFDNFNQHFQWIEDRIVPKGGVQIQDNIIYAYKNMRYVNMQGFVEPEQLLDGANLLKLIINPQCGTYQKATIDKNHVDQLAAFTDKSAQEIIRRILIAVYTEIGASQQHNYDAIMLRLQEDQPPTWITHPLPQSRTTWSVSELMRDLETTTRQHYDWGENIILSVTKDLSLANDKPIIITANETAITVNWRRQILNHLNGDLRSLLTDETPLAHMAVHLSSLCAEESPLYDKFKDIICWVRTECYELSDIKDELDYWRKICPIDGPIKASIEDVRKINDHLVIEGTDTDLVEFITKSNDTSRLKLCSNRLLFKHRDVLQILNSETYLTDPIATGMVNSKNLDELLIGKDDHLPAELIVALIYAYHPLWDNNFIRIALMRKTDLDTIYNCEQAIDLVYNTTHPDFIKAFRNYFHNHFANQKLPYLQKRLLDPLELSTNNLIKRSITSTAVAYFDNDYKPVYVTTNGGAETPDHIQAFLEVDFLFSLLDVPIGTAYHRGNDNKIKPIIWANVEKMIELEKRSDKIKDLFKGVRTEYHDNDLPIGIMYLTKAAMKHTEYNIPEIFIYQLLVNIFTKRSTITNVCMFNRIYGEFCSTIGRPIECNRTVKDSKDVMKIDLKESEDIDYLYLL